MTWKTYDIILSKGKWQTYIRTSNYQTQEERQVKNGDRSEGKITKQETSLSARYYLGNNE